ncbi:hypothetical protein KQX54_016214 [Cotesia glomerata]|uniref:Cytochrome c biogenesis B n=1 Tax=Cotesia glomerata TaxID=32391 RepID=A0AAV7ICC7_COTGL|nr:hypothetical protein KQX54_016214 [Cotesia glomerata]
MRIKAGRGKKGVVGEINTGTPWTRAISILSFHLGPGWLTCVSTGPLRISNLRKLEPLLLTSSSLRSPSSTLDVTLLHSGVSLALRCLHFGSTYSSIHVQRYTRSLNVHNLNVHNPPSCRQKIWPTFLAKMIGRWSLSTHRWPRIFASQLIHQLNSLHSSHLARPLVSRTMRHKASSQFSLGIKLRVSQSDLHLVTGHTASAFPIILERPRGASLRIFKEESSLGVVVYPEQFNVQYN